MKALGPVVSSVVIKFGSQSGGDNGVVCVHAVLLEVLEKAFHAQGRVGFGAFIAVGQELGAAGELAKGVLAAGQVVALPLGPLAVGAGLGCGRRGVGPPQTQFSPVK